LLIVDGKDGYIWNWATNTFSTIASAGGWTDLKSGTKFPQQVEYLDGYFIVTNGTMSFWVSNLYDGTTWNALATAAVVASPDPIISVIAHHQQLYFIKKNITFFPFNFF
jgi:hypothetical protein